MLVLATQARSRRSFLVADFLGLAPVAAHYVLLSAPAGAAMSALYMVVDIAAAFQDRYRWLRRGYLLLYPAAVVLVALTFDAAFDLLALGGTLAAIAARRRSSMRSLLALIVVSCLGWGLYGVFAQSVSQVVFSGAYAILGLLGITRIRYLTHA